MDACLFLVLHLMRIIIKIKRLTYFGLSTAVFSIITIQIVQNAYASFVVLILLIPILLLIGEGIFTLAFRGGKEYKFISPCIMLYLASVIPAICFMERFLYDERMGRHICQNTRSWLSNPLVESADGCQLREYHRIICSIN